MTAAPSASVRGASTWGAGAEQVGPRHVVLINIAAATVAGG